MSSKPDLLIEFEPNVLAEILAAAHLCSVEISGLARVIREGRRFRVFGDSILPPQVCSPHETDPTEAIAMWFNTLASSGNEENIKDMEIQRLWWHSHVWFDVYFSTQDFTAMRNLLSGFDLWWLAIVVNKRNQYRLALVETHDGFLSYEEAPLLLNPRITAAEFRLLVREKVLAMEEIVNQRVKIIEEKK